MKIALITETYPPEVNGVAMTNQRLVRGLLRMGHEVGLILPRKNKNVDLNKEQGLEIHSVAGVPIPNYPGLRMGIPTGGQMERLLESIQPDVVHIATEGPLGFFTLLAARRLRIPITSTFHTNFQDYCADYGASFLKGIALAYLRWFHNQCALTTVPDPILLNELEKNGLQRLKMLGRGADIKLFHPAKRDESLRREWGAKPGDLIALYTGRIAAEKNIPMVLETWRAAQKKYNSVRMVVVGDGPIRKKLARRYPDVHFAGMRYDEDLARHYASADIFLFASLTETFGNVIVEAMSSGLAVLTYNYAAGRQFIIPEENGITVPLGDEKAFLKAFELWIENPSALMKIKQNARMTAEKYPWESTIEQFAQYLKSAHNLLKPKDTIYKYQCLPQPEL